MSEAPRNKPRRAAGAPPKSPSVATVNQQNHVHGAPPPANGRVRHKRPENAMGKFSSFSFTDFNIAYPSITFGVISRTVRWWTVDYAGGDGGDESR